MSFHFNDMAEEEHEDMVARVKAANEDLLGHFINVLILEKGVGKIKAHQYADDLRFLVPLGGALERANPAIPHKEPALSLLLIVFFM